MTDSINNFFLDEDFGVRQDYQEIPKLVPDIGSTKSCNSSHEAKRKKYDVKSLKVKKEQAALTIKWLRENYCACPEVCLPREIIYGHYLEFCKKTGILPACKATFGKLIRNTFPNVTSKRLGARGQSKYHYNGIGIQQSSEYFNVTQASNGVTRFSSCATKSENMSSKKFSLTSKIGTLLPSFPEFNDLILSESENKEKMKIFLTMYRIHCQCIVDTTIGGNFEETRLFLLHFWQGFPDHLMTIFEDDLSLDLIGACDSTLYRTLIDVLIPTEVIDVAERLLCGIQNIASHWVKWLECSLENMPPQLRELKINHGRRFSKSLKRHAAFLHLAQVTRPAMNKNRLQSLSKELSELQMDEMAPERVKYTIVWTKTLFPLPHAEIKILDALENLLEKDFLIDSLIELLDGLVRETVESKMEDVTDKARYSIFHWVYTLSKISYWMTENKSDNFITFHLLSSLLQEYLLLGFENQRDQEEEHLIHSKLKKHLKRFDTSSKACFKSPTSCFLVTDEKQKYSLRLKQRGSKCDVSKSQVDSELDFRNPKPIPYIEQSNSWIISPPISQPMQVESTRNETCLPNYCHTTQVYVRGSLGNCACLSCGHEIKSCTSIPMTGIPAFEASNEISVHESQILRGFPLPLENYSCTNLPNYSTQQSSGQSHLTYSQYRGNVWDSGGYVN